MLENCQYSPQPGTMDIIKGMDNQILTAKPRIPPCHVLERTREIGLLRTIGLISWFIGVLYWPTFPSACCSTKPSALR